MRAVSASSDCKETFSVSLHSFVVDDVMSSLKDVVEALIHEDPAEKEVFVRFYDPQSEKREEVRLTNFRVDKVQSPLQTAS